MRVVYHLCALIIIFFSSCKKVIELDLKESDIKYVIEGVVTNEPGSCKVLLSKSKPFYEDNQFEGISGAVIKVMDNGVGVSLQETAPGVYEASSVRGTPGHVYQLSVSINSQEFSATCTMPPIVPLRNLYISSGPLGQFKFATVEYNDPSPLRNYYRFVQYLNGVKDRTIFWENDEFTNGLSIAMQLDTGVDKQDDPRNIQSGDRVTIEMLSLDATVFQYWYSLHSGGAEGSTNVAAPANPVSNIAGGALGYFSAHSVDRKTVVAP